MCASGEDQGLRRAKSEEGSARGEGDPVPAPQDGTEGVPVSGADGAVGTEWNETERNETAGADGTGVQTPTSLDSVLRLLRILLNSAPKEGVGVWATIGPLVGVVVNVFSWAPESRALIIRHRPDGVALLVDALRTAQSVGAGHKSVDRSIRYVTMVLNALAQGRASGQRVIDTGGVELLVAGLQSGSPGVARESTLALGTLLHTCRDSTKEALSRGGWAARGILPWSLGACDSKSDKVDRSPRNGHSNPRFETINHRKPGQGKASGEEPENGGKGDLTPGKDEEGGDRGRPSRALEKVRSGSAGSAGSGECDSPRSVLGLRPLEDDVSGVRRGQGSGEEMLTREKGMQAVIEGTGPSSCDVPGTS